MLRFLALALFVLLGSPALADSARADALEDALAGFTKDGYAATLKAIDAVVASGSPRSLDVIQALKNGDLTFSKSNKKVYISAASGALLDAATGEPVIGDTPPALKKVKVNNRVRGAIEAALGSLGLLGPDPAKRMAAAEAVLKSRDTAALPLVEAALAKETDASIKRGGSKPDRPVFFAIVQHHPKPDVMALIGTRPNRLFKRQILHAPGIKKRADRSARIRSIQQHAA